MAKDQEADPSSLNLYQKLARITGEVGVIAKDGNNTEQNFKFIEYAAVAGRLRDLFAKYGVVVVPSMPPIADQQRVTVTSKYGKEGVALLLDFTFEVINADKPDDRFSVTWTGEAVDYGDKATNKAATGALKYYLMRQFNISEKGEDPDAESPERGAVSKPASQESPVKREPSIKDLLSYAGQLLERGGVTEQSDKVTIIEGIADVVDLHLLTPNKIKLVIRTLREMDIEKLKSLYLLSADDLPEDEPNATVIIPEKLTADDIKLPENPQHTEADTDIVDLYAQKSEAEAKTWVVPDYPPSKLMRPEQGKLIKTMLEYYETVRPGIANTYVKDLIGKDIPGTRLEADAVLFELAASLNDLAQKDKAA